MHHLSTFWYKQDLVAGGGRWWPPWRWLVVAGGGRLVAGGVHLIAWCPLVAGSGVHLVAIDGHLVPVVAPFFDYHVPYG